GPMTPDHIVSEALSLEANEVFTTEMEKLRTAALMGLVVTPANDTDTIRDHQAMVRAIDDIRAKVRLLALTNAPKQKS
ncbi:hypothetical protein, partial [Escherichia coli]|uniref:hypothetical protein n=1 Tax=Escherichia coli TaxID=562 RepID=UPI003D055EC7